jgi:hypothetical protein
MTHRLIVWIVLAASAVPLTSFGQLAPSAFQRQEQFNSTQEGSGLGPTIFEGTAPSLYPGETQDIGPQYLVTLKPKQHWVSGFADTQFMYTSNALLSEEPLGQEVSSGLIVATVQAAFEPTPFFIGETGVTAPTSPSNDPKAIDDPKFMDSKNMAQEAPSGEDGFYLAPRVGFRYQWYIYEPSSEIPLSVFDTNDFNFDVMTVFADTRFVWGDGWIAGVGFEWNRLLGFEPVANYDYQQFYQEWVPTWRFGKAFAFSDEMVLTAEYFGDYRFTNVDPIAVLGLPSNINDRTDHGIRIQYSHELLENFYVQPWYRFQYTYWTQVAGGQNDFLNTVGLTFSYVFTDWCSVRTFVTYDTKDSDVPFISDYDNLNAGGGVSLSVRF